MEKVTPMRYKDLIKKYPKSVELPYGYNQGIIEFLGKLFPAAAKNLILADKNMRSANNRFFGFSGHAAINGTGVEITYQKGVIKMYTLLKRYGDTPDSCVQLKSTIMNNMVIFKNTDNKKEVSGGLQTEEKREKG